MGNSEGASPTIPSQICWPIFVRMADEYFSVVLAQPLTSSNRNRRLGWHFYWKINLENLFHREGRFWVISLIFYVTLILIIPLVAWNKYLEIVNEKMLVKLPTMHLCFLLQIGLCIGLFNKLLIFTCIFQPITLVYVVPLLQLNHSFRWWNSISNLVIVN